MRPITRMEERTERTDETINNKISDLDKKLDNINAAITKPRDDKVSDIMKKIREQVPEIKTENKTEIKNITHENEVSCPTCGNHIHKLTSEGLTAKCIGDKCGAEYILVPKDADHKCTTCGLPIKKPIEGGKYQVEACPLCGNKKALKFNLSDLIKQDTRRAV